MDRPDDTKPPSLAAGLVRGLWRLLMRPTARVFAAVWWWVRLGALVFAALVLFGVVLFAFINPPTTLYIASEKARLGTVQHTWVDADDIAPVMMRAVVAAEDANFCNHWGFDMGAIRQVIAEGESRGASTITQQTVKNVYLWPARSWGRKAVEALITPVVELVWTKRRILEVYLNMIEFDEGVFGIEAAAMHHFGHPAALLTENEAARLAAVLPDPKRRSAINPGAFTLRRSAGIRDGAATILSDGRASCFED